MPESKKKTYEPPFLVRYGDVRTLVQDGGNDPEDHATRQGSILS